MSQGQTMEVAEEIIELLIARNLRSTSAPAALAIATGCMMIGVADVEGEPIDELLDGADKALRLVVDEAREMLA